MIFKIKKGKHYSQLFFKFWWNKKSFKWSVKFDGSCRYRFDDADRYDINKLVGVGWLPHLHAESARFGWVYNPDTDKVEIYSYCYINSIRYSNMMASVKIGEESSLSIDINENNYVFMVNDISFSIKHKNSGRFQYLLKPYFGGNKVSPNNITITIS